MRNEKQYFFLLLQSVKFFLIKNRLFLWKKRKQMAHSYFTPIFKIQIVKIIKAAGGFFCTL